MCNRFHVIALIGLWNPHALIAVSTCLELYTQCSHACKCSISLCLLKYEGLESRLQVSGPRGEIGTWASICHTGHSLYVCSETSCTQACNQTTFDFFCRASDGLRLLLSENRRSGSRVETMHLFYRGLDKFTITMWTQSQVKRGVSIFLIVGWHRAHYIVVYSRLSVTRLERF